MKLPDHDLISVKANLSEAKVGRACCASGRSQNQFVTSPPIITMLLVLFGLSSLKLR